MSISFRDRLFIIDQIMRNEKPKTWALMRYGTRFCIYAGFGFFGAWATYAAAMWYLPTPFKVPRNTAPQMLSDVPAAEWKANSKDPSRLPPTTVLHWGNQTCAIDEPGCWDALEHHLVKVKELQDYARKRKAEEEAAKPEGADPPPLEVAPIEGKQVETPPPAKSEAKPAAQTKQKPRPLPRKRVRRGED